VYEPDSHDALVELSDVPRSEAGSPLPLVVADDNKLLLAYIVGAPPVVTDEPGELFAVVRFRRPLAHFFGPPNDESFNGHPLYARGLRPYSSVEVRFSSWIRALERMNSVHPRHDPARFATYRHFIFAFHDSTFECVAHGYDVSTVRGRVGAALRYMANVVDPDAASQETDP
jgi:hypothetical protein